MRILFGGMALAATLALGVGGTALPAAATAKPPPVVYTQGMGGRWAGAAVRPREIVFGAGYYVTALHWSHWKQSSAFAAGKFYACDSDTHCPIIYKDARVGLTKVKSHKGRAYFSYLTVSEKHHGTYRLVYSNGAWVTLSSALTPLVTSVIRGQS